MILRGSNDPLRGIDTSKIRCVVGLSKPQPYQVCVILELGATLSLGMAALAPIAGFHSVCKPVPPGAARSPPQILARALLVTLVNLPLGTNQRPPPTPMRASPRRGGGGSGPTGNGLHVPVKPVCLPHQDLPCPAVRPAAPREAAQWRPLDRHISIGVA